MNPLQTLTQNISPVVPTDAFLVGSGMVFPLDHTDISVGRGLKNLLIIDDQSVSRVHAKLVAENGYFTVYDMKSTNGIAVNAKPVHRKRLHPGDVVRFGDVSLMYLEGPRELLDEATVRTQPLPPIPAAPDTESRRRKTVPRPFNP